MQLTVDLSHQLGAFSLTAAFSARNGITALFGRSGAGKSSLVNMIAGLIKPQKGHIYLGDTALFDAQKKIHLPIYRRRIGCVFQEHRLFPHLTVRQNLIYGQWFNGKGGLPFSQIVDLLGIETLLNRRPFDLSGGEKQRVAIGRALLANPKILLMDEPLASLDMARKAEILPYIERLRDELSLPIIYVSHSMDEVMRLANTLVLLEKGKVIAFGATSELLNRIDLPSLNRKKTRSALLPVRVKAHDIEFGLTQVVFEGGILQIPQVDFPIESELRLRIRARDVAIALAPIEGLSIRNQIAAQIVEIKPMKGPNALIKLKIGSHGLLAFITRAAVQELALQRGRWVYALIKGVAVEKTDVAKNLSDTTHLSSPFENR